MDSLACVPRDSQESSVRWILISVNLTLARMGLNVMIWEEIITVPALMTMMEKIVLISRTTARTILVK